MHADRRPLVLHVMYRFDTGGLENGVVNLINHMPRSAYRHMVVALTEVMPVNVRTAGFSLAYSLATALLKLQGQLSNKPALQFPQALDSGLAVTDVNAPLLLLAEDNPMNQKVLVEQLQTLGYRVEVADDGQIALARHVAEMARPIEEIHFDQRRVRGVADKCIGDAHQPAVEHPGPRHPDAAMAAPPAASARPSRAMIIPSPITMNFATPERR